MAGKVGKKKKATKEGIKDAYNLLYYFWKSYINEIIFSRIWKPMPRTSDNFDGFNKIRVSVYRKKYLRFDIEQSPPISAYIKHIGRAYREMLLAVSFSTKREHLNEFHRIWI